MKKSNLIDIYLRNYSVGDQWHLKATDTKEVSRVVVIPALAEKESLFATLASLARNPSSALDDTLVICVVNNLENSSDEEKENNLQTMECLRALAGRKSLKPFEAEREIYSLLTLAADTKIRLAYIDAASDGNAMPSDTGGVGLARKMGMDTAVRLMSENSNPYGLILSLDADTLVLENYLTETGNYFTGNAKTAIVAYEHQLPSDPAAQAAMCCYEIFLRYWVLGLQYAKSPWAFHAIGSTIITSVDGYLDVRGMNRRRAGEDFYFLNKLAKIGDIGYIKKTCVFPSARSSSRVPFGTGKRIQRFLAGDCEREYRLYDPRIFFILAGWLQLMNDFFSKSGDEIMTRAGEIHPVLRNFLAESDFPAIWLKINRCAKDEKTLLKQFNDWFDSFRTLKLINYLTKEVYPQVHMFKALNIMLEKTKNQEISVIKNEIPSLSDQIEILHYLRRLT